MHSKFGLFQMSSLSLCAALSKVNFVVYYNFKSIRKSNRIKARKKWCSGWRFSRRKKSRILRSARYLKEWTASSWLWSRGIWSRFWLKNYYGIIHSIAPAVLFGSITPYGKLRDKNKKPATKSLFPAKFRKQKSSMRKSIIRLLKQRNWFRRNELSLRRCRPR